MPILLPRLDDHDYQSLVDELVARIPAHTPEWTHPRPGDPGRTLIDLFAWLGDAILYRANLVPERQRLAFLRLLGKPLEPAIAARGIVTVELDEDDATDAVDLAARATLEGPAAFETRAELTVLPVTAEAYVKSPLSAAQKAAMKDLIDGLETLYGLEGKAEPYETTPVFAGGAVSGAGFDIVKKTVDRSLWLALLAPPDASVETVRQTLGGTAAGRRQLLNVGVAPAIEASGELTGVPKRAEIPHTWEISTAEAGEYLDLDPVGDTPSLARREVLRLTLPGGRLGAPVNDVGGEIKAGVGDRPPRLDDPRRDARLVAWLRLVPGTEVDTLPLAWVGVNAVEIEQRQTLSGRIVGQSDGSAGQQVTLPDTSVEASSLELQVEESGRGYQTWTAVDDIAAAGRDDAVCELDSEAGTVRFGDGVRGRIPELGMRLRVETMRSGGGKVGNLAAGSLTGLSARDLSGRRVTRKLTLCQPLATSGGVDAETLAEAEQRIPAWLAHRDRAVTAKDFRNLARETPGVRLGRVDVLPRFKPQQRPLFDVPGVVSVMVWPDEPLQPAPNPRPDRPQIERIHAWLDERRPLATELWVIGCDYVALGVSAALRVRDGFDINQVLQAVREALRLFLWPLEPGGPGGEGWPLGRAVDDRELEVAAARVAGIEKVAGVRLFRRSKKGWEAVARARANAPVSLALERWQLPELQSIVVVDDDTAPGELRRPSDGAGGKTDTGSGKTAIAVPVVPEVC